MKSQFFNFKLMVESVADLADNCFHSGKLFLAEEAKMARFIAYPPRKRTARNKKVYQDGKVRVMQCPDGSYVMTVTFEWQGTNTWSVLTRIMRDVYQALKSL